MSINNILCKITGFNPEILVILLGMLLYYFHYLSDKKFLITNIIITAFVLAIFDVFLKKIILLNVDNDYYKFVVNNIITIVVIDYLIYFIKNDSSNKKKDFIYYFNLAFACFFYETIVFKLYNYNNLCNKRLRNVTKTILRLATIHILSSFLNGENYDKEWFDFSFGQIFDFSFFEIVFSE